MKKTAQNLIEDLVVTAKSNGLAHLHTEDYQYDGRIITINQKPLINFGLCSYLGLEVDPRLKRGAIEAIERYGIHFSCSRAYVSTTPFSEMERLVEKIFDAPVALSTCLSLGHHSVMPVVIGENDAIILDQQVHSSVRDAAIKMQGLGVKVTIVRHNDLNDLQLKLTELAQHYDKIWYMIDGVYSMYGDYAPITELYKMMQSNKKLHIYADDAHGMGWIGDNGRGYILSKVDLHPKLIVASSLNKAFGAGGGVFVFYDKELCQRVKNCGTGFIFSAPHSLPVVGAAIESAKIFLSGELPILQQELALRVRYCQKLLVENNLPVISNPETPIFFIGLGLVRVGYNLLNRVLNDGFYANLSSYPAVPENCTGIRFTITLHHSLEDIEAFVKSIAYHFPQVLSEEGRTRQDIDRAFRKVIANNNTYDKISTTVEPKNFKLIYETSIHEIPTTVWNDLFASKGNFDWASLALMEEAFSGNQKEEENWNFHYYIVTDQNNKPIVASYFTDFLNKDDMLSPASVSAMIEERRKMDPYSFTSRMFMMGSMVTEGDHLFVDRTCNEWRKALMLLIDAVWKQHDKQGSNTLLFRDFSLSDTQLGKFFMDQGLVRITLPDTHIVDNRLHQSTQKFLEELSSSQRYYVNRRAVKCEEKFEVEILKHPTEEVLHQFYDLYLNVSRKSLTVNAYPVPFKFFSKQAENPRVEFISLKFKLEDSNELVAMAINYVCDNSYHFILTGLNYDYQEEDVYTQMLWQIIKRARALNMAYTALGFTASQNKMKFGAQKEGKMAFVQINDDYNMTILENMSSKKWVVKS